MALKARIAGETGRARHDVELTYITTRGGWYDVSWKGSDERSGGLVTNIGIHLFDLLQWLFGRVGRTEVHLKEPARMAGFLELERADVRWFLSTDASDLPFAPAPGARATFRAMTVDGAQLEFSEGFGDLHTRVYEAVLAGRGCGIDDARPSIELTHQIRHAPIIDPKAALTPQPAQKP
jgi:UDP-N-acetyl-2-amino-2-deoxyglucuronate dehydrogenase